MRRTSAADHATIINRILATNVGRQKRLNLIPLLVSQPKQVASHDPGPTKERKGIKESLTDSPFNTFKTRVSLKFRF
jgi:hypothetical protein